MKDTESHRTSCIPVVLLIALLSLFTASCGNRDRYQVLKVLNWTEYIDPAIIPDFEAWYKAQTGETVHVDYQIFDRNEKMYRMIARRHKDYDLVCPSDYLIERLLNTGMLIPLDFISIPDSINYITHYKSPYIQAIFSDVNPLIDANDYTVAYMWGTTGILYNTQKVTDEEANTWGVLRDPKFSGQVLIKDAPRDVYAPILIYLKQRQLKEGSVTIEELMHDSSEPSIAAVENFLKQVKGGVLGWEADHGKEQMISGNGSVSLNWSGDAVWSIKEAAERGVSLNYCVPEEGSTFWFDGWVIPKYAKNIKAAAYFIDFMCRPDIAIRNMEATGYTSANGSLEVLYSQIDDSYDPIDLSYFFGPAAASVCVNPVQYPDQSVVSRCVLEHDWGRNTASLLAMWARIKFGNTNRLILNILIVILLILLVLIIIFTRRSRRRRRGYRRPRLYHPYEGSR